LSHLAETGEGVLRTKLQRERLRRELEDRYAGMKVATLRRHLLNKEPYCREPSRKLTAVLVEKRVLEKRRCAFEDKSRSDHERE
jgi:hypothetical protein